MKKHAISILFSGALLTGQAVLAQETDYHSVNFTYAMPPTITIQGDAPKTFDLKVLLLGEDPIFAIRESDAVKSLRKSLSENNYQVNFPGLQQVDSTTIGDLHIISVMSMLQLKAPVSRGGGNMISNVVLYTFVSNGEGTPVFNKEFKNENFNTTYPAGLTSAAQVMHVVLESAVAASLQEYQNALNGYTGYVTARLADLDGVKKLPDLKAFEDQVKELKPILAKEGADGFCKAAEKYVPYWQQQADNHLEKNGDEVKRAAYQDLSLYFLLKGEPDKARQIIEAYKPIDKTMKEMMVLKYKNSEDMEKLANMLFPEKQILTVSPPERKISLRDAVVQFMYLRIDGTAVIDDRKNSGTYTGTLYIKKPVPGADEQKNNMMLDLDTKDFDVTIEYIDNGAPKEIQTKLSKVKSLKDKDGNNYTVIKGSENMLGDMNSLSIASNSYILMKETFASAKISMYRILLPTPPGSENSMLIRKAGDAKGVRTRLINFKKNLTDYLGDCTATTDMIKQSKNINGDINKILETYSTCSN